MISGSYDGEEWLRTDIEDGYILLVLWGYARDDVHAPGIEFRSYLRDVEIISSWRLAPRLPPTSRGERVKDTRSFSTIPS
jgi:hypothetical protein